MNQFLKTKKTQIIGPDNKPITLRGVNFGGWLMMEAYILYAPNNPERGFKEDFAKKLGPAALKSFEKNFRANFVCEDDFKNIAQLGFNCVRVPFNHRLVESTPYHYSKEGLKVLDDVLAWAKKYKVYVILDLHGAAGCQNHDWHSDSFGKAELWTNKVYQKRTLALWKFIADRYKNEPYLAGYDLLNESILTDTKLLNRFYKEIIGGIRHVDKNHILFIEGNRWAQDIECLEEFDDDNYALSIHNYEPIDFTFNFVPQLSYPLKSKQGSWDKKTTYQHLLKHKKLSDARGVPIFVGEFGINARNSFYGEDKWLDDTLRCYKELGFHWTYWTYKAIKNFVFPDGVYSYLSNPPWVNRVGPKMGWDTFASHWPTRQKEMIESWQTKNFEPNTAVLKTLQKYAR